MPTILTRLRHDLKAAADPRIKAGAPRFFKEKIKCHGTPTAEGVRIGKAYFQELTGQSKPEVFALCEELFATGYNEEAWIAADWADRMQKDFRPGDFKLLERWLATYVDNWAKCDTLCNHAVGSFLEQYPQHLPRLQRWTKSPNRWLRRGAAVSLVLPARRGQFLPEALAISDALLRDPDDLVQKGYGWLLKEASRQHQTEVFEYVLEHKAVMPRTALRYAIEKLPPELRKQAMQK